MILLRSKNVGHAIVQVNLFTRWLISGFYSHSILHVLIIIFVLLSWGQDVDKMSALCKQCVTMDRSLCCKIAGIHKASSISLDQHVNIGDVA